MDRPPFALAGQEQEVRSPASRQRMPVLGPTTQTFSRPAHGFGLQSSALAARDLGGTLRAASADPARGATFALELPMHVPQPAQAATVAAAPRDGA